MLYDQIPNAMTYTRRKSIRFGCRYRLYVYTTSDGEKILASMRIEIGNLIHENIEAFDRSYKC